MPNLLDRKYCLYKSNIEREINKAEFVRSKVLFVQNQPMQGLKGDPNVSWGSQHGLRGVKGLDYVCYVMLGYVMLG
jgi:hypothetical protein